MNTVSMLGGSEDLDTFAYRGKKVSYDEIGEVKARVEAGLRRLVIMECELAKQAAGQLGRLLLRENVKLGILDMHGTKLGMDDLRAVSQALRVNAVVERLGLVGCRLEDIEGQLAILLDGNTRLRHLLLSRNDLSLATGLPRSLKSNKELATLDLSHANLQGTLTTLLCSIEAHPTLRTLNVSYNNCRCTRFPCAVGGVVLGCKALRTLNIAGNSLGEQPEMFLGKLQFAESLTELNISQTGLKEDGVASLKEGLRMCENLLALDLSNNDIGDSLSNVLSTDVLHNIKWLSVSRTGMGRGVAQDIADFMEDGDTLLSFDVSDTKCIGDVCLADVFMRNRRLPIKGLNLSRTGLSESAVRGLLHALREYTALQSLLLENLSLHSGTLIPIVASLTTPQSTVSLIQVSFSGNSIADIPVILAGFKKLFERNPSLSCIGTKETHFHNEKVSRADFDFPEAIPVRMRSGTVVDAEYSPSPVFFGVPGVDE